MVDLFEIQVVYYMVAATGVLVAAVFHILNLRISQKNQEQSTKAQQQTLDTRQVQLFMNIYQKFEEPEFQNSYWEIILLQWRDFDEYIKKIR